MALKPGEYIAISEKEKAAMEHGVWRWRVAEESGGSPPGECECCRVAESFAKNNICNVCPLMIYQGRHTWGCVRQYDSWACRRFSGLGNGTKQAAGRVADYIEEVLAHCKVEL